MTEFSTADAHEWLDGLKPAERDIALQTLDALRALVTGKGFGAVTTTVVAGKLKQMELKQTYQASG